jgi:hypothetical protein
VREVVDDECEEKRLLSREFKTWSRSLRSNFWAIISAAFPLGQRIMGIDPKNNYQYQG